MHWIFYVSQTRSYSPVRIPVARTGSSRSSAVGANVGQQADTIVGVIYSTNTRLRLWIDSSQRRDVSSPHHLHQIVGLHYG